MKGVVSAWWVLCSDTSPFFLVSLVTRFPVMAMFLLFCFFCACAAPAALPAFRPRTNNDFASLLIRDHPSAARVFADESFDQFNSFWHLEKDPSERGDPTATADSDSNAENSTRKAARRLAELNSILDVRSGSSVIRMEDSRSFQKGLTTDDMHVHVVGGTSIAGGGRQLHDSQQGKVGGDGLRTEITTVLNIFYRYGDNSTAIAKDMVERVRCHAALCYDSVPTPHSDWLSAAYVTPAVGSLDCYSTSLLAVACQRSREPRDFCRGGDEGGVHGVQSRALEQKIMDHDVWENICRQQEDGRCHPPSSFATVLYATEIESGESEPVYKLADSCALSPCPHSCCHAVYYAQVQEASLQLSQRDLVCGDVTELALSRAGRSATCMRRRRTSWRTTSRSSSTSTLTASTQTTCTPS